MSSVKSISAAIEEIFARQDRTLASLQSKLLAISRTQSKSLSYPLSNHSSPPMPESSASSSPTLQQRDKPVVVSVPSINAPSTVPIDHGVSADGTMSPVIVRPNTSKVLQAVGKKVASRQAVAAEGGNKPTANGTLRQASLQQRRSASMQKQTPSPKNAKSVLAPVNEVTPSKGINKRLYGVGSRLQAMAADVLHEVKRRGSQVIPSVPAKEEVRSRPPPAPSSTTIPVSSGKYMADRRHHHHHQAPTVSKWDMSQRLKELEDIRASNTQALERTASGYSRTHSRVKVEVSSSPPKDAAAGREARIADIDRMKEAAAQIPAVAQSTKKVSSSVNGAKRLSANRVAAKSPRVFVQRLADGMIEHYSARGSRRQEDEVDAERAVSPLHSDEVHVDPNSVADDLMVRRKAAQPTLRPPLPLVGGRTTQPKAPVKAIAPRTALTHPPGPSTSKPPWSNTTKVVEIRPQVPPKKGVTAPR